MPYPAPFDGEEADVASPDDRRRVRTPHSEWRGEEEVYLAPGIGPVACKAGGRECIPDRTACLGRLLP